MSMLVLSSWAKPALSTLKAHIKNGIKLMQGLVSVSFFLSSPHVLGRLLDYELTIILHDVAFDAL